LISCSGMSATRSHRIKPLLFRIDESRERFSIQKFNSEAKARDYL
jgi:hypothetical protein